MTPSSLDTTFTSETLRLAFETPAYYSFPPEPDARGSVEYKLFLDPSARREQRLVTQLLWRLGQSIPQLLEGKEAQVATYMLGVLDDGACIGVSPSLMNTSLESLSRMAKSLSASSYEIGADGLGGPIPARGVGLRIVRAIALRKDHVPAWSRHLSPVKTISEEDRDMICPLSEEEARALLMTAVPIALFPDLRADLARTRPRTSTRSNGPDLNAMRAVVAAQQRARFPDYPEDVADAAALPDQPKLNKKRHAARARRLRRKIDMIRREREGMGIFDHSELEAALGISPQDEAKSLPGDSAFNIPHSLEIEDKFSDRSAEGGNIVASDPAPTPVQYDDDGDPGFAFSFDLDDPVDAIVSVDPSVLARSTQSSDRSLDLSEDEKASGPPAGADLWLPQVDNCRIVLEVQVIRWLA